MHRFSLCRAHDQRFLTAPYVMLKAIAPLGASLRSSSSASGNTLMNLAPASSGARATQPALPSRVPVAGCTVAETVRTLTRLAAAAFGALLSVLRSTPLYRACRTDLTTMAVYVVYSHLEIIEKSVFEASRRAPVSSPGVSSSRGPKRHMACTEPYGRRRTNPAAAAA